MAKRHNRSESAQDGAPQTSDGGTRRSNLPIVRFVVVTLVSLVVLFYIIKQPFLVKHFVNPYTNFVAAFSRACLRLVGVNAGGEGSIIVSPEFSVSIKNVCNGLEVTAIFFATVIGFPSSLRSKLIGLAVGYPVVFLVNVARIMVLFVLGFKVPDIFDAVHYYYAQAFVIIATVAVWFLWVNLYSDYGSKAHHRVSD